MAQHTPEPWLLEGNTVYALQDCVFGGKPAKENRFSAGVQGKAPQEELHANALVMRAAPELLAACKAMLADVERYRGRGGKLTNREADNVDAMYAAVAKAEGR